MLPRYLIIISRNDLALPQDEVYFEDADAGDGSEEWETVSSLFGKVSAASTITEQDSSNAVNSHLIRRLSCL